MALSVLSALARLNVDPWREAAELSELPRDAAAKRLTKLVARLPVGAWAPKDCEPIADRLIQLLPRHRPSVSLAPRSDDALNKSRWALAMVTAAALAVAILVTVATWEQRDHLDDPMPVFPTTPQSRQ